MPRARTDSFRRTICLDCYKDLRRIKYKYPHSRIHWESARCEHCDETLAILEIHKLAKRMRAVRHRWLVSQCPGVRSIVRPFLEPPAPMSTKQLVAFSRRNGGPLLPGVCKPERAVNNRVVAMLERLAASETAGAEAVRRQYVRWPDRGASPARTARAERARAESAAWNVCAAPWDVRAAPGADGAGEQLWGGCAEGHLGRAAQVCS